MTFNKNGIRILDNPKAANAIVKVKCLPDQHNYKPTGKDRSIRDHLDQGWQFLKEVKCTICGETDWE